MHQPAAPVRREGGAGTARGADGERGKAQVTTPRGGIRGGKGGAVGGSMSRSSEIIETAAALDERDKAILVALAQHKLLTTGHIHTLFFSSLRRTQTKIQELREKGFINTLSSARARGK